MGIAPAAMPVVRFKPVEPAPVPKTEPAPAPVAPLVIDVKADQIAAYKPQTKPAALARIAEIAAKHGFTLKDLTGPSRRAKIVVARHEAIVRIAIEFDREKFGLARIGSLFGDRDHTTILYAICKHVLDTGEEVRGWSREGALERIRRKCVISGVSILHFEKVWKFRAGASA
jgi:hypothetical protein